MSGLTKEDAEDEAGKAYAILISDTVVVTPGGAAPEVATAATPKDWKEVAYYLKVRSGLRTQGHSSGPQL